jgi:hypothetical protein
MFTVTPLTVYVRTFPSGPSVFEFPVNVNVPGVHGPGGGVGLGDGVGLGAGVGLGVGDGLGFGDGAATGPTEAPSDGASGRGGEAPARAGAKAPNIVMFVSTITYKHNADNNFLFILSAPILLKNHPVVLKNLLPDTNKDWPIENIVLSALFLIGRS